MSVFCPPNIHKLKSNPQSDDIWRYSFGHEGIALVNGISALIRDIERDPDMWEYNEKTTVYEPESELSPHTESVSTLIFSFLAVRTVRKKFQLLTSHLVYGILL